VSDRDPDVAAPLARGALSPALRATVHAIAEALFTTEEGPPPEERLAWLVDDLDDFFVRSGARALFLFRLCVLAVSLVAPLFVGKLAPFRALSQADRLRALERLEQSPLALAIFGAKTTLCVVYYEHPDAARAVGFDGSCLGGRS
jgi:hypothetical protein